MVATTFLAPPVAISLLGCLGLGVLAIVGSLCAVMLSYNPARVKISLRVAKASLYLTGSAVSLLAFAHIFDKSGTVSEGIFWFGLGFVVAIYVAAESFLWCRTQDRRFHPTV